MPSTTSGYINGRTIAVANNTPTRTDGYDFIGWCTKSTNDDSCYGTSVSILSPSDIYTFNDINYKTNNALNLYAIWEQPAVGYMQDITEWENQIPNTGDQILVKDKRDNKKYWVARQADGNIWMTENLDFEITGETLTSELTNLTAFGNGTGYNEASGYTEQNGIIKWTPTSTVIASTETINGVVVAKWTNDNYEPYSAEGGDTYVYTSNSAADDTVYASLFSCILAGHKSTECRHYHKGDHYNWSAAVASNNTNTDELTSRYTTAKNSICPAGWKLPVGRSSGTINTMTMEFSGLLYSTGIISSLNDTSYTYTTNGFNKIRSNPLYLVRGGGISTGGFYNSGIAGYYHTSSSYSTTYMYQTYFNNLGVMDVNVNERAWGYSLRCMVPRTMQTVDEWGNTLKVGDEVIATDVRDGKKYTVAKQADKNIWMTQNLDFEITSTPLTSDTSDLTTHNTGGYTSSAGYSKTGDIIKWTPASTAITSGRIVPVSTSTGDVSGLTGWADNKFTPYSAEGGDVYIPYTSDSEYYSEDTIYTSLSSCIAASHTETECKHYHRGNYYNWSAAVASNNTNVTELNTQYNTAQNSICPAGWKLPVGAKADTYSQTNTEFAYLFKESNVVVNYPSVVGGKGSYATGGFNKVRSSPLFFVRDGHISGTTLASSGILGLYWCSSSLNSGLSYFLYVSSDSIYFPDNYYRSNGFNIRCVVR